MENKQIKLEEKNSSDLLTANTLFLSKKDGKYGCIKKDGTYLIECSLEYDYVGDFYVPKSKKVDD